MKLLWLCNMVPGRVKQALDGSASGGGLWVDSVLDGLTELGGMEIRILCPGTGAGEMWTGAAATRPSGRGFPMSTSRRWRSSSGRSWTASART